MQGLTAIWYCRIRRTPAMKYRKSHSLEDCSTAIAEFGQQHNFFKIPFVMQQVAQISYRATSAQILVKRGTESRFWAFVGVQRKWKNRRLRFVAFMLYWGKGFCKCFLSGKRIFAPSCMARFRFKSFSEQNWVSQNQKSCVFEFNKRFLIRLEFCLLFSLSEA